MDKISVYHIFCREKFRKQIKKNREVLKKGDEEKQAKSEEDLPSQQGSSSGLGMPAAQGQCVCRCPGMLRAAGFFCVSPGTHRAAELPLSGIGKPGSGIEPIHRGLSH